MVIWTFGFNKSLIALLKQESTINTSKLPKITKFTIKITTNYLKVSESKELWVSEDLGWTQLTPKSQTLLLKQELLLFLLLNLILKFLKEDSEVSVEAAKMVANWWALQWKLHRDPLNILNFHQKKRKLRWIRPIVAITFWFVYRKKKKPICDWRGRIWIDSFGFSNFIIYISLMANKSYFI